MRLQRQRSRKVKGKEYDKWVITIPPKTVENLEWEEGTELKIVELSKGILVAPAVIKDGDKETSYKMSKPKKPKYTLKGRFLKTFNNVPTTERGETIAFIEDKPISWNVAYGIVLAGGKRGEKLLKYLEKLRFI